MGMKLLVAFLRLILGPGTTCLLEDLHVRFIGDWLAKPGPTFLHPECVWTLDQGHPQPGTFVGPDFCDWYTQQRALAYQDWEQVVTEVIGSRIGAIVVGTYRFKSREDGCRYSISFTQFYQVRQGKIVSARYFTGTLNSSSRPSRPLMDLFSALHLPSLN